jgi:hypothetical protein
VKPALQFMVQVFKRITHGSPLACDPPLACHPNLPAEGKHSDKTRS